MVDKDVVYELLSEEERNLVNLVVGAGGVALLYVTEDGYSLKGVFMLDSIENVLTEIDVETEGAELGFVWAMRPLKWKGENTLETEVVSMTLDRYRKGGRKELYEFLERHFNNVDKFIVRDASNEYG